MYELKQRNRAKKEEGRKRKEENCSVLFGNISNIYFFNLKK
jgi:hypothetical protein